MPVIIQAAVEWAERIFPAHLTQRTANVNKRYSWREECKVSDSASDWKSCCGAAELTKPPGFV